jgi:hypothetical protein
VRERAERARREVLADQAPGAVGAPRSEGEEEGEAATPRYAYGRRLRTY